MAPLIAAVVLAWIAIVLLAFAMAGILRQLRDVQAALSRQTTSGDAAAQVAIEYELTDEVKPKAGRSHAAALLVDDSCVICAEVTPAFVAMADTASRDIDFVLLSRGPLKRLAAGDKVRVVIDGDAYHLLDPGWRPALVVVDGDGEVVAAEPAGSAEALRAGLAGFTKAVSA